MNNSNEIKIAGLSYSQQRHEVTLGELITLFYEEYLERYGDEELASVATAASINELLIPHDQLDA